MRFSCGALSLSADATAEFVAKLNDPTQWVVKRGVPLFKAHDRYRLDPKSKKRFVAYTVTDADLYTIASNMRKAESRGEPARMTVGHTNPDPDKAETEQPRAIGYWRNARVERFGPTKELGIIADAYIHRELAPEVKGRIYRSVEYYHDTREITGAAVTTRDPALKLGTVELYKAGQPERYSLAEAYEMAEPSEEKEEKAESAETEKVEKEEGEGTVPEGHDVFLKHMEHYAKSNPWMAYAQHCYNENQMQAAGPPSGTAGHIPNDEIEHKPEPAMNRMQRDDEAIQYSRMDAEIKTLRKQMETYQKQSVELARERDAADCERMIRTAQAQGYTLTVRGDKDGKGRITTADLVAELMEEPTKEKRQKAFDRMLRYAPKGSPMHEMIETYSGNVETPAVESGPTPEQIAALTREYAGDELGFEKQLQALRNGHGTKN